MQVNGEFKCFGTLQHLKSRFGKGIVGLSITESLVVHPALWFTPSGLAISAKVQAGDDTTALKAFITSTFPNHEFKSEHSV